LDAEQDEILLTQIIEGLLNLGQKVRFDFFYSLISFNNCQIFERIEDIAKFAVFRFGDELDEKMTWKVLHLIIPQNWNVRVDVTEDLIYQFPNLISIDNSNNQNGEFDL
jgi:hypothetical protein